MELITEKAEKVTETLTVYQKKGVFSYGTDAVLLADFVDEQIKYMASKKMCDFCSGTGVIPLLLCDRHEKLTAVGVEINENASELSKKSAMVSGLSERFSVHCGDIKNVREYFPCEAFDFITCNPPYMKADCGKMCDIPEITLARHEIACDIYDVFKSAFYLLPTGGLIFIVYRTDRISSLMAAAKNAGFEIKELCFVKSRKNDDNCDLLLCKAKKQSAEGTRVYIKQL